VKKPSIIDLPVAVCSRSLSRHKRLRELMQQKFSQIRFNEDGSSLKDEGLRKFLEGNVGAIVALEKITEELLSKLPELKAVSKYGVGLDNIDQQALIRREIQLGWSGGVNARSVAELTLGFILGLLRNIFLTSRELSQGRWQNDGGFQLTGKTVGIVGCGYVGKELVSLLKPFQVQILVHDIVDMGTYCRENSLKQVGKDEILRSSDVVTLHIPYNETTQHFVGGPELAMMKKNSLLINTSRGLVVDEKAVNDALVSGHLGGAACDVFAVEPPRDNPLLSHARFVGTPHIGGSSDEAIMAMGTAAIENLEKLMRKLS
jgi:phosphoglycerate dehydrogenase-like enzyme